MFSKEESKKLRQGFWIAFGKSYPHKWTLYDTKIKGLSFKFAFELRKASVAIAIESDDLERRILIWEKLLSLKSILKDTFPTDLIFDDSYLLSNRKEISRVYVEKTGVSIHDKNSWRETMIFLNENMKRFETFFEDYKEILAV